MSDNANFGFGKFVPGFDFLQNLAKGATQGLPLVPNLSNWIAPTLSVEELEKRIGELKAVHFWLDQNGKALAATIQALEVQKMTLATLKGMNFSMGEVADSLKLRPTAEPAAAEAAAAPASQSAEKKNKPKSKAGGAAAPGSGMVDPLQWWGALTQQFQQIAADALKDTAVSTAMDTARNMAADMARDAAQGAGRMVQPGAAGKKAEPARKAPRKAPARKKATA